MLRAASLPGVDEAATVFQAGKNTEFNFKDSYRYNIAGYKVARLIGLDNVPMTAEARKIHAARATGMLSYEEPDAHCLPQGVPKINSAPVPFRIVQTEKLVVLVYEAFNLWRQVHLDGRDYESHQL